MLPPLTYLTVDSMSEGVGMSQVVPYVERLAARGVDITLHSFEKEPAPAMLVERLRTAGVRWRPHRFGARGPVGGVARVAIGAAAVKGADLVHARSDLAAAACLIARPEAWVYDMRALWREERMGLGLMKAGAALDRIMRRVEDGAVRSSDAIVSLSAAAIDLLGDRHGESVAAKSRVITTCVDLDHFRSSPLAPSPPVAFLLVGTLNALYDVPAMVRLVERLQRRRPATLTVLTPDQGRWAETFRQAGALVGRATFEEMPTRIAAHHVGLCLRRSELGDSSRAATPTKLGEFLACGRPVVVSAGLGDMDDLLAGGGCGVVVDSVDDGELDRAAAELCRLVDDPATPARCRALAESHFDVDRGVDALVDVYRSVTPSVAQISKAAHGRSADVGGG